MGQREHLKSTTRSGPTTDIRDEAVNSPSASGSAPISSAVQRWRGTDPLTRAVGRTSAEMATLASRRMQAMMALPAQMATCRSPFDVMSLQMSFMQTAADQYGLALRNMQATWLPVMPMLGSWPMVAPPAAAALPHTITRALTAGPAQPASLTERDLIVIRDPVAQAVAAVRQREKQAA